MNLKQALLIIFLIGVLEVEAQVPLSIENIELNYVIGTELNFVVDIKGYIYIYDRNESTIVKFDKRGNFVKKIGSRGRGPNEFLKVSLLMYNKETDLLYAYDMPSFSVKEITTNGEFINQYDYPDKQMVNPFYGFIENNMAYLVFYNPFGPNNKLVHQTDIKQSKTINSYFSFDEITNDKDKYISHNYNASPYGLHSQILKNGDLLLLNSISEEYFYVKKKDGDIQKIKLPNETNINSVKRISKAKPDKKYKQVDDDFAEINSFVIGIAEIDTTFLVFQQTNTDKFSFGYHVYKSKDYEYIGYTNIEEIEIDKIKYDYIYVYPKYFLMAKGIDYIYFGDLSTEKFSILKLEY